MSPAQRRVYFRLWAAATMRQGWDVRDEERRRSVTAEATGHESTSDLDEDGITKLFRHLEWLIDPDNLDRARPVACPEDEQKADERRRAVWVIRHRLMPAREAEAPNPPFFAGRPADPTVFSDAYVQTCARGLCAKERVGEWKDLSGPGLAKLIYTLNQRRQQKGEDYEPRKTPYARREGTRAKRRAAREPQVVPRPAVAAAMQQTDAAFPF